jgi:outer membrane protein OmpA-like peptidoglycan-associated protein
MSQLMNQASNRKAGIKNAVVAKKPTQWYIVTSSGGGASVGEVLAAGGTHGNLYISRNPEDHADSPGVIELSYTGVGGGPSASLVPFSVSFSMTQMPSKGRIYDGPLSSGKDIQPDDLTGPCVVWSGSVHPTGAGGSLTLIFFRSFTFAAPATCKAFGMVGGMEVGLPGLPSASAMYYLGYLRVSQVNPETLDYKDTFERDRRQANLRVVPLALPADVLFDFDRAVLKPGAEPILQSAAQFLARQRVRSVVIEGHTDSKGTDQYNLQLSADRANAVRNWLVGHQVLNAGSFVTRGMGKSQPIAPNARPDGSDNPDGRRQNRRVSIVLAP